MSYQLRLRCTSCSRATNWKPFNVTEPEMQRIFRRSQGLLATVPQCRVCPTCNNSRTIKSEVTIRR
jgi:arginyl-tRNA--protein-N-Asp/Glu arginylyltransferase